MLDKIRRHGKIEKSIPPCPIDFRRDGVKCLKADTFDPRSYKNEENDMAVTITKKTVLLMSLPQRRGKGR